MPVLPAIHQRQLPLPMRPNSSGSLRLTCWGSGGLCAHAYRSLRAELAGGGATAGVLYPGWVSTPLTHNVTGGNVLATELVNAAYPKPLRRFISPEEVAQAAVSGIQKRAPRIMVPSRWILVSMLRGILDPLTDWGIGKHKKIQALVNKLGKQSSNRL